MSWDQYDDSHAECNDCQTMAFEPKSCFTCGPCSKYCAACRTRCPICDEWFCDDDYPMHKALCLSINMKVNATASADANQESI